MISILRYIITICLLLAGGRAASQSAVVLADSIRIACHIPELSYAVVSADTVYELHALGVRKLHEDDMNASLNDRFRIGSNTKAITGFIAALLVKQGKITWDTKFFDLFPELKAGSRKEYLKLTLADLLTFRTQLFPYTYTNAKPVKSQFKGTDSAQRYQFTKWFFRQPPVMPAGTMHFSNLGYVAAGLMLEKAAHRPYMQLVIDLGTTMDINFGFGQPNQRNSIQTWGHDANLVPEGRTDDFKLRWLLPAGNINATLPDYLKFIQLQLQGLQGRSSLLTKEEFEFLHFGRPRFSVGWFQDVDSLGRRYSYNIGNPGTFLSKVFVFPYAGKAIILFCNVQSDEAEQGLDVLLERLKHNYGIAR